MRNRCGECPLLPVGSRVHVTEYCVRGLPCAVDTPLLLDSGSWLCRLAKIEQHTLVLARGVMQADTFFPGSGLNQDNLRPTGIVLKLLNSGSPVFCGYVTIEQQYLRVSGAAERLLKCGNW